MSVLKFRDENGEFQPLYLANVVGSGGGGEVLDGTGYIKIVGGVTNIGETQIDLSAYISNLSQITSILGGYTSERSTTYPGMFYWNRSISPEGYMDAIISSSLFRRDNEEISRIKLGTLDGDTTTNKLTIECSYTGRFNSLLIRYNPEV